MYDNTSSFPDAYYGDSQQLPESSEYLLEIKQKRRGTKRTGDRRPKAQPIPEQGSVYAPGAISFLKPAIISSRLNEVDDVNTIPLPQFEPGTEPKVKEEEAEEEPVVYNFAPTKPEPEKIVDTNTGYGGWTKVAKKEE